MYHKILVPLEPGDQPVNLDHAQHLAGQLAAELIPPRVVTVMPSEDPFFTQIEVEAGSAAARIKVETQAQLASFQRELRSRGPNARGVIHVSDKSEAEAIARTPRRRAVISS